MTGEEKSKNSIPESEYQSPIPEDGCGLGEK